MTPLAYWWTAVASSAPVARSTRIARPDSVPKSMPTAVFTTARPTRRAPLPRAVVRRGPGLPLEMAAEQPIAQRLRRRVDRQRPPCHRRDRLERDRRLDGRARRDTPRERAVTAHENRGSVLGRPTLLAERLT